MKDEQKNILIQKLKRKCYITDNSKLINDRIEDLLNDSIIKVCDLIGISDIKFDFSKDSLESDLLKNYFFYLWNDKSIKEFEEAYLSDILKLRHHHIINSNEEISVVSE